MRDAERVIRENASRIRSMVFADLLNRHDEIVELAVTRATTIGVAEYGDASFHKPPSVLSRERFEEYADAYFYAAVEIDKRE